MLGTPAAGWRRLRHDGDAAARVRRVRRPGAARARLPPPQQAPARARRRRAGDGHHRRPRPVDLRARRRRRPRAGHRDAGPRAGPARRSSSATGSGSSATCPATPDTLARIVRVEERTTVLRRTADDTDPVERVVVANADQLVIVTAVADPTPRTGFVDRCLVAAYAGGLDAAAVPDQGRPGRPRRRSRRSTPSWSCRCWSTAPRRAGPRRTTLARRAGRPGRRRWSGTRRGQVDAGQRAGAGRRPGASGRSAGSARAGTRPSRRWRCRCPPSGGWVIDTPGVRSFGLAHVDRRTT